MKTISTLSLLITLAICNGVVAQTVYTVTKDNNYSAACTNCTFNISAGVKVTINQTGTCTNCTFIGGSIDVNKDIVCQPCSFNSNVITVTNQSIKPNSGTTSFQNVSLTATGNSTIVANTPVTITNSVFTFTGTGSFTNNGGQLDLSNSTLNFYGSSSFLANAGPVNLKNGSKLVAGNGTVGSTASIKINGPVLNIYDNTSAIVLGNTNNTYYNWNSYNSVGNNTTYTTTYPSVASLLNCGAAGQNACGMWSSPSVFGPSAFNYAGVSGTSSLLPVVMSNFAAANTTNGTIALNWSTQSEINAAYFTIERSANSASWTAIGKVSAKGNSAVLTHYAFTDASALAGLAYYRLVMVDLDGSKTYSNAKVVRPSAIKDISFYPNPAVDVLTVVLVPQASETTVALVNQAGQVVLTKTAAGNASVVSLNVQQYPRGLYIVKVSGADGASQTGKLLIAH